MTSIAVAAVVAVATNLPSIVVEASRLGRSQIEVPAAVHVIDADAVASSGARDVVDLLMKKAPELHIRNLGSGNPAMAEISMRGYGENGHGRTLVQVDGERLNSPDLNAPNLSRIALAGVSKIEVLGGSQNVLHGGGASAGVVNVITEPQDYSRRSYLQMHGGSWGGAGTALGTRGGIEEEGLKYWADGSWDRSDGYRDNSGYDIWNLNGGVRKDWLGGTFLRVSGFYNDSRYDLPGALSYREFKDDPRSSHSFDDRFLRRTSGFSQTFSAGLDDENTLKTSGNFSWREMDGYQKGDGWWSRNEYDIWSYRILTEWINTSEIGGCENEFIAGAQYAADLLEGTQKSSYSYQRPDYGRQTMDFYAQDTFHLAQWLALQPGGRYSRAWSYNNLCERDSRTDDLAAFDAAVVVNPADEVKIYVKGSRIYRCPFLDEVPGRFDAGYNWVNTEILAPEKGWTSEAGVSWEFAEEFSVGADVYYTWLEDEIFYNAAGGNNENCGDSTLRRGFDAHAAWERDKTAGLSLAASCVRATFEGGDFGGNFIPLVPETALSANGRVWLRDDCFVFGGLRYQSGMYSCSDFRNDWRKLSWYGIFNIGATCEPTFARCLEGFVFSVAVDNLFDRQYCDYSTYGTAYYPAAGRSFTFTVRYEF